MANVASYHKRADEKRTRPTCYSTSRPTFTLAGAGDMVKLRPPPPRPAPAGRSLTAVNRREQPSHHKCCRQNRPRPSASVGAARGMSTVTNVPGALVRGMWYAGRGSIILSSRFVGRYTSWECLVRGWDHDPQIIGTMTRYVAGLISRGY